MAGTKVLAQAIGTGVEGFLKNFAPQLTDAGRNSIKLIRNRTDGDILSKLNPEQTRQVIEHANKGQLVLMMNDVENAGRGLLDQSREAKAIDVITRDPNAPIQPEAKPYQLSEDVEDFMGDTDLPSARSWLKPGGGLEQTADDRFLVAGTSRTVTDASGKNIKLKKGDRLSPDMINPKEQEYYDSLMASGWALDPEDSLSYGFKKKVKGKTVLEPDELSKMADLEGKAPGWSHQRNKALTFHHLQMKKIAGVVHRRARQLLKEGKATVDDLVNLHAMSNQKGQPSGSRKSAGLLLEESGHNFVHKKVAGPEGFEPSTTKWENKPLRKGKKGRPTRPPEIRPEVFESALKAADELGVKDITRYDLQYIQNWSTLSGGKENLSNAVAKWKVFRSNKTLYKLQGPDGLSEMDRYLKDVDNMSIAELTQFLKGSIDDIATPMTEQQILVQEVMDNLTGTELMKIQQDNDWDTIANLREALIKHKEGMSEARSDKALRKQMNTAFNE